MNNFGAAIREWRNIRKMSQLELSMMANVSSKHISFLENGRSNPSKDIVIKLSNFLNIPTTERNYLLKLAGFAEAYSTQAINFSTNGPIQNAVILMLEKHSPFPGVVFDKKWNVLLANKGFNNLLYTLNVANPSFKLSSNILDLIFDPESLKPNIVNWEEVSSLILKRLNREELINPTLGESLIDSLSQKYSFPEDWQMKDNLSSPLPVIPVKLQIADSEINLFSIVSTIGTAIDAYAQELTIELYYPVDEKSKKIIEGLNC